MNNVSSGNFDPITLRFLNVRPIASFFLGAVFIIGAKYSSLWLRGVFWRCGRRIRRSDVEDGLSEKVSSLDSNNTQQLARSENLTLAFALSICFVFASIARFASLLSFHSSGAAACAFVVAWGGMAAQTARLIGLVILLLELRYLGIGKWETLAFVLWTIIGIVFLFVNNALATGFLRPLAIAGVATCERNHVLSTSLVSSLLYLALELYVIGRLLSLFAPDFLHMRHRMQAFNDPRIWKTLSLLLLELLLIAPLAMPHNKLGDIIPFSIGSILVLVAFNHRNADTDTLEIPIDSIPPSIASRAGSGVLRGSRSLALSPSTTGRSAQSSSSTPVENPHPFSSKSLNNPRTTSGDWAEQLRVHTARSSRSLDTDSIRSAKRAIVQMVQRRRRPPQAKGVLLSPAQGGSQHTPPQQVSAMVTTEPGQIADKPRRKPDASISGLPPRPRIAVVTDLGEDVSPQELKATPQPPLPLSALFGQDAIRPPDPVRVRSAPPTRPVSYQTFSTTPMTDQVTSQATSPSAGDSPRPLAKFSRWPTFNETDFPPNAIIRTHSSRRSSLSSLSTVLRGQLQSFPLLAPISSLPPLPRQSVIVGAPRGPRPPPNLPQRGS